VAQLFDDGLLKETLLLWLTFSYPAAASRADLFLVLGEQHHHASPMLAPQPRWLASARSYVCIMCTA